MNKAEAVDYILKNDDAKVELIERLLKDTEFVEALSEKVFCVPMIKLGINVPGTLGEFLLSNSRKKQPCHTTPRKSVTV